MAQIYGAKLLSKQIALVFCFGSAGGEVGEFCVKIPLSSCVKFPLPRMSFKKIILCILAVLFPPPCYKRQRSIFDIN